ncbi:hypothetical protein [Bacillus sp. IBL03825]|uniref:hypothetical protein n=1 Tax=Bacillus sp. IBL03825 TaxID=2953580 RepID=UPI0021581FA8|nr:hypothetical protein [Bacillus sp. IBL03825]MCR6845262.1 hypothetical protein [Bacillus sp. IBL03825]
MNKENNTLKGTLQDVIAQAREVYGYDNYIIEYNHTTCVWEARERTTLKGDGGIYAYDARQRGYDANFW